MWLEGVAERHVCARRPGVSGGTEHMEDKAARAVWKARLKGGAELLGGVGGTGDDAERVREVAGV